AQFPRLQPAGECGDRHARPGDAGDRPWQHPDDADRAAPPNRPAGRESLSMAERIDDPIFTGCSLSAPGAERGWGEVGDPRAPAYCLSGKKSVLRIKMISPLNSAIRSVG